MLYNNLTGYLKGKYGARMSKICVDGGFSCPNRDGTIGRGGCIYCSERGSGDHIEIGKSIENQVRCALEGRREDEKFIVYFQNFTNTYAEIDVLKERYDSALIDERIKILAIGTRPDCINEDVAKLISSYKEKVDVWVELGLQTASDETAEIINRGYKSEVYLKSVGILKKYGIDVVTHIMIGLPGEDEKDLEKTIALVNKSKCDGIKIHSVYIAKDTALAKMYERGEYIPIEMGVYTDRAVYALTHIRSEMIVHRITGDCPKELLVAPEWNRDKNSVILQINQKMQTLGVKQGSNYKDN